MDPQLLLSLRDALVFYLGLVLSIALHEYGHAKAADLLGDPLPRLQGRVTLNPLVHLDPIGTGLIPLMMIVLPILTGSHMPLALIGWGRPVQIALNDPRTRVRNEILITLAGPAMNALIALFAAVLAAGAYRFLHGDLSTNVQMFSTDLIILNASLIVFNAIPLPPLDGSRIFRHVVGMSEATFYRLAVNSWWILLVLINLKPFQTLLAYPISWLATFYINIANILAG